VLCTGQSCGLRDQPCGGNDKPAAELTRFAIRLPMTLPHVVLEPGQGTTSWMRDMLEKLLIS
jgi:hypothetical protein